MSVALVIVWFSGMRHMYGEQSFYSNEVNLRDDQRKISKLGKSETVNISHVRTVFRVWADKRSTLKIKLPDKTSSFNLGRVRNSWVFCPCHVPTSLAMTSIVPKRFTKLLGHQAVKPMGNGGKLYFWTIYQMYLEIRHCTVLSYSL